MDTHQVGSWFYNSYLLWIILNPVKCNGGVGSAVVYSLLFYMIKYAAGLGGSLHSMYLGEISPMKIRGRVTLTSATFTSLGKLSGQFFGLRYDFTLKLHLLFISQAND